MKKRSPHFQVYALTIFAFIYTITGCATEENSPTEPATNPAEEVQEEPGSEEPAPEPDVADAPIVSVLNSIAAEESPIELYIDAALSDTDGSEELSVEVCNFPKDSSVSYKGFCRSFYNELGYPSGNNDTFDECALTLTFTGVSDHKTAINIDGIGSCLTVDSETFAGLERPEAIDDCDECPEDSYYYNPVCVTQDDNSRVTYRNPCEATRCADIEAGNWEAGVCGQAITITPVTNWLSTADLLVTVTATETATGETASVAKNISITATSTNDAPRLSGGLAGTSTIAQNGSFSFSGMVSDADWNGAGSTGFLTLTITTELGQTTVLNPSGIAWDEGMENGQSTMQFHCPQPRCNEALATITYQAPTDYTGVDSITFTVDDNGNTGADNIPKTDTKTMNIEIN